MANDDDSLLAGLPDDLESKFRRYQKQRGSLTGYQRNEIEEGRAKDLVFRDYVVVDLIGHGGQAKVCQGYHIFMDRIDALKLIDREKLNELSEVDERRFLNRVDEGVRASAKLEQHENIVLTYSFDRDLLCMAMEYVDGPDLGKRAGVSLLPKRDRDADADGDERTSAVSFVSEPDALDWIEQAAKGLQHAHDLKVVHRDVKPGNLLFDETTQKIRVSDWGLARIDDCQTAITPDGEVLGTAYWKSPEQVRNAHSVDHRADVYSLGCTLYSILTGTVMYRGKYLVEVELAHYHDPIPPIGQYRRVSDDTERLYTKMVAKNPGQRHQSMSEVIEAVRACRAVAGER